MSDIEKPPLASVVMPVYNGQAFLEEALLSIELQTFSDYELLIIDDGSTDATSEILESASKSNPRIHVIRQSNKGVAEALNVGLRQAKSQIIVRMDADDIMMPNRIERQVSYLKAHPQIGICGCGFETIGADSKVSGIVHPHPRDPSDFAAMLVDEKPLTFTHPTVAFRRELAIACGGYKRIFEPTEDMELFNKMILNGTEPAILDDILMKYRVHEGSISGSKLSRQLLSQECVRRNFYRSKRGLPLLDSKQIRSSIFLPKNLYELRWSRRFVSEFLKKRAFYAHSSRRPLARLMYLGLASLWRPEAAFRSLMKAR